MFFGAICDDKVYVYSSEHSPNTPPYRDELVRCLNATTGQELWKIKSWGSVARFSDWGFPIADGQLAYLNVYDMKVYSIGKGPSQTTITASPKVSVFGSSVIIEGTVTDIAAGTNQNEQAARFPNGVPAVSDASQSEWMEYVYMQKARPTNTVGVPVTISVVDANGNYREIGSATTSDGFFTMNWKPDIEGQYTVYASFEGSNSYWPSHAMTSFAVDPAPATPAPTEAPPQSTADMYFVPAIAGLFVLIIIVLALVVMIMLKKRP
jgi:hypothetical protein